MKTASILIIPFILLIYGCQINVSKDSISGLAKSQEIHIDKITVTRFRKDVPRQYSVDTSVIFMCADNDCNTKKINFNKPEQSGYWLFWKPIDTTHYDIMPLKFQNNSWYKIWAIHRQGKDLAVFLYFDETGKLTSNIQDVSGPF